MTIWNILLSTLFIIWLFAAALLMWRIWQSNEKRSHILEQALNKVLEKLLETRE